MITIFATPKPFQGHNGMIQRTTFGLVLVDRGIIRFGGAGEFLRWYRALAFATAFIVFLRVAQIGWDTSLLDWSRSLPVAAEVAMALGLAGAAIAASIFSTALRPSYLYTWLRCQQ